MTPIGRAGFERKLREKADLTPREFQLIMLAYRLAKYGHRNQERDDGGRYFEHPKRVALILIDENTEFMPLKPEMVVAALLHDIKEDSFILTWEDIEMIFGKNIKEMIETLTKDKTLEKQLRTESYFKRLITASSEIKNVKLADRLDNMRDLGNCSPEKQKTYFKETTDFFLPLARKTNWLLHHLLKQECDKYANKELP
ncbi:MAG: bifunctional (p)ppGpp synthetase/guanosine-3',5'-bis(diphosphate) 3'-pyrophosphohydrolase [Candidatus Nealsonbacteria bacterium]|nr:bifunctional (p)ppGpp synthetase/guanosine-3',5'-bis(diphosphate) 3'-pyrophosphohydrolase [Candidatus Nealsonbacteria bacterium]